MRPSLQGTRPRPADRPSSDCVLITDAAMRGWGLGPSISRPDFPQQLRALTPLCDMLASLMRRPVVSFVSLTNGGSSACRCFNGVPPRSGANRGLDWEKTGSVHPRRSGGVQQWSGAAKLASARRTADILLA